MGLSNIFRVFGSFVAFSLVMAPAYSQNKWDVAKPSITTEYYVLKEERIPMRPAPAGRDVMVIDKATPNNSSYTIPRGGEQTIQQRGTIEAVNKSTTLKGRFKWSSFQVKSAMKTAWKVGKITPVSLLGSFVLDMAIDKGKEWYTGDDGHLYFKGEGKSYYDGVDGSFSCWVSSGRTCFSDPHQSCHVIAFPPKDSSLTGSIRIRGNGELSPDGTTMRWAVGGLECEYKNSSTDRTSWARASSALNNFGSCPPSYKSDEFGCYTESLGGIVPESDIFDLIDQIEPEQFSPDQFDSLIKTAELDSPVDFMIDSIAPVVGDPVETVVKDDITGDEIVIKDTPSYDFNIGNDNGNPIVTGSTTNKNDVYTNGSLTGSTSTTNVAPPYSGVGSIPSAPPSSFDFEECRDLPESCQYYAFMQDDFIPPSNEDYGFSELDMGDIDLSNIFEYDFDLGVSASCPAPYILDLDMFGTVEVSFEPLCQVADDTRPFVITSAIIASLFMLLGSSRKM